MPDLTAAVRAAVEAKCADTAAKASTAAGKMVPVFDALKHENTERWVTGLKHHTGFSADNRPQFTSDHSIGAMHWRDKAGVMQPINTDWAVGADGWSDRNETSQARILVDDKGVRRIYPDQRGDAYIEFAPPEYWDGDKWQPLEVPQAQSAKAVTAETAKWIADHWRVEVVNTGSQSKLSYVMLDEKAPSRVRWPYTCYACSLDEAGNLTDAKGVVVATVYQGRAEDADGAEVAVKTLFDKGSIEYMVDVGKAALPVTLDPTVDYQVGAGSNDYCVYTLTAGSGGTFAGTDTGDYLGYYTGYHYYEGHLFTSVTISAGATIDVAYASLRSGTGQSGNTCNLRVYANKTASPSAAGSATAYWALAKTTLYADWSGLGAWTSNTWYNSASLVSPIGELVGAYNYSGGLSLQLMIWDNGSSAGAARQTRMYEYTGNASGAKLHIEYTAAATGFKHYLSLLGVGR